MPIPQLRSLAASSGLSLKTLERHWAEAKKIVKKEYGLDETDPRFWALTTGVTKKMSAIKENTVSPSSFKHFLNTYGSDRLEAVKNAGFEVNVDHDDQEWTATGKMGTNRKAGAEVAEYMRRDSSGEHRIWMDKAGTVFADY